MNDKKGTSDRVKELIDLGADLTGSAAGGVLGSLAAGPAGAAVGAMLGTALEKAIKFAYDFANRHLSEREKKRIGAALTFALYKIDQYLSAGCVPREDGFFDSDATDRSPSHEILEGVLLKCKSEIEEKKCKYISSQSR